MIPKPASEIFEACIDSGAWTATEELEKAVLAYFRLLDPATVADDISDAEGGIVNRIIEAARNTGDGTDFFESVRTKRYTDAKLRRAMLFVMTGVTRELLRNSPAYTTLLGAGPRGREIIAMGHHTIPIITRAADIPRNEPQFIVGERMESLFTLARQKACALGDSYRRIPFIKY